MRRRRRGAAAQMKQQLSMHKEWFLINFQKSSKCRICKKQELKVERNCRVVCKGYFRGGLAVIILYIRRDMELYMEVKFISELDFHLLLAPTPLPSTFLQHAKI